MVRSLLLFAPPKRPPGARVESAAVPERRTPARAGQIGPIRREIIFEPLHEQPAPPEPAPAEPAAPETQPREPAPTPS